METYVRMLNNARQSNRDEYPGVASFKVHLVVDAVAFPQAL